MVHVQPMDVREGDRWTLTQRAKNDAIYFVATAALTACRWLPRGTLVSFAHALAFLAHAVARGEKNRARTNVMTILGSDSQEANRLVRACFRAMSDMLADSVSSLFNPIAPFSMSRSACEVIERARAGGRGVVLPSAHLGSWERVAQTLVTRGVPLMTLVRESYDPRFDRLHQTIRSQSGVRVIARGHPQAPFQIVRALRQNLVLGAPMDLRSRVPSVLVPFLGHDAWTAVGPARIALRTGAPVVVSTLERIDDRLEITATRIDTGDLDSRAPDSATTLTSRINDELSRRILTAPELWPWMHARW